VLNKHWHPIHVVRAKTAFKKAIGEKALFLDHNDWTCYNWEEWVDKFSYLNNSVPSDVKAVPSGRFSVRLPELIILNKYDKVPRTDVKLTRRNLLIRDNWTCQYTGKKLRGEDISIDHIIPRSQGGTTTWTNVAICDWKVNARKAGRTPKEANLQLIKQPTKPQWNPLYSGFVKSIPQSWTKFLKGCDWEELGYWDVELEE
jgi:5-methylcytosine-specific restriction endonuclease McrA